jgi:hypothetical protein
MSRTEPSCFRGKLRGIRGAVVIVALAAALAPGSVATAGEPLPFPLGARASWTLTDEHGSQLKIRSTRSGSTYVLHGFPGLASVRVRANGREVQAWDARVSTWRPFLRLSAAAGARYRVDLPSSALWRAIVVTVASREPCLVGSRPVRSCVTLELQALKPIADAGVERLVFAPGIGPVEVVVQTIAGPRSYALGTTGPLG